MSKAKPSASRGRVDAPNSDDSPAPRGPGIPTAAEIAAADDGQADPQLDNEILDDCDYLAAGGWAHPVNDLVGLLHVFGGPWLFHADRLATLLREAQTTSLKKEQDALQRVRTELASVKNKGSAGLAEDRLKRLRAVLDSAIKQTNQRLNAIPSQGEREERAVVKMGARLKEIEALHSSEGPDNQTPTPGGKPKNHNDARDKTAYELRRKGKSLQEIKNQINAKRRWQPLESVQGVSAAAKRYAQRNNLPWPV
jgi:hypothetical protein